MSVQTVGTGYTPLRSGEPPSVQVALAPPPFGFPKLLERVYSAAKEQASRNSVFFDWEYFPEGESFFDQTPDRNTEISLLGSNGDVYIDVPQGMSICKAAYSLIEQTAYAVVIKTYKRSRTLASVKLYVSSFGNSIRKEANPPYAYFSNKVASERRNDRTITERQPPELPSVPEGFPVALRALYANISKSYGSQPTLSFVESCDRGIFSLMPVREKHAETVLFQRKIFFLDSAGKMCFAPMRPTVVDVDHDGEILRLEKSGTNIQESVPTEKVYGILINEFTESVLDRSELIVSKLGLPVQEWFNDSPFIRIANSEMV